MDRCICFGSIYLDRQLHKKIIFLNVGYKILWLKSLLEMTQIETDRPLSYIIHQSPHCEKKKLKKKLHILKIISYWKMCRFRNIFRNPLTSDHGNVWLLQILEFLWPMNDLLFIQRDWNIIRFWSVYFEFVYSCPPVGS